MTTPSWLARMSLARRASAERVAESPDGKEFLIWLRRLSGNDAPTLPGDDNAIRMAYNEGRRSIWLEIQAELSKDMEEMLRQDAIAQERSERDHYQSEPAGHSLLSQ